ncbi:MAG: tetratricopeptide repeat protein [Deltaproteobacteria bacterium]|nr:tetratricopeptide repeat protein [Deltaproteobacteria bacterium]
MAGKSHLVALLLLPLLLVSCLEKDNAQNDLTDAREYMRHRDFIEAEKSFERYLRRNPDGPDRWEVWNHLVDLALNVRHNRMSAIELLEAMTVEYESQDEERRVVLERLASEYELARRYDRAMELWIKLDNDLGTPHLQKAGIYRSMARIYLRRLEFELARESLTYCLALEIPQSLKSDCQYDLADAYMVMEDLDAGINELRSLLEQDGVDDELRVLSVFMLADALEQKGDKAGALELFESIRFSYPNGSVMEARIEYLKNPPKR